MPYLITILAYLIFLFAFGLRIVRRVKKKEDFLVAGRTLTAPILVGTLLATWIRGYLQRFRPQLQSRLLRSHRKRWWLAGHYHCLFYRWASATFWPVHSPGYLGSQIQQVGPYSSYNHNHHCLCHYCQLSVSRRRVGTQHHH